MGRFSLHLPNLETLLWVIASVIGFAVFLVVVPSLFNLSPNSAAIVRPTSTIRPTLTPLPTGTPIPLPPAPKERTSFPVPTAAQNSQVFNFVADTRRSGWFVNGDTDPHWGDRNLHAGTYKGQTFQSVLYFNLIGLAPGSRVLYAEMDLTGLSRVNLGASGSWSLNLLPVEFTSSWIGRPVADFRNGASQGKVGQSLGPADLAEGQVNQFVFSTEQLKLLEGALNNTGSVGFRLDGPPGPEQSLFTWDAGDRDSMAVLRPALRVIAIPQDFVFITNTPTPQNVITAAAMMASATAYIGRNGTPTPFPRRYATVPPDVAVTSIPTPANEQTATAIAAFATAVAFTTGTFTPTPLNFATVTPTPTSTPTPGVVSLYQVTAVPTATPRVEVSLLEAIKTPIPSSSGLVNNVIFYTWREGGDPQIWVMRPDGSVFAKLTGDDYYSLAAAHELFSPDSKFHVDVGRDSRGFWMVSVFDVLKGSFSPLIMEDNKAQGIGAYNPAWSPTGGKVAFVSGRTGIEQIYVYDPATQATSQLTYSTQDPTTGRIPYNKHPSWSPDGKQIIFWSDRGTDPPRKQIWIMNADGGGQRNLSPSLYNDWDPIWVKR